MKKMNNVFKTVVILFIMFGLFFIIKSNNISNEINRSNNYDQTLNTSQIFDFQYLAKKSWNTNFSTQVRVVKTFDIDNDSTVEIITGGWYANKTHELAEICIWNYTSGQINLEASNGMTTLGNASTYDLEIFDIDNDGQNEIISVGDSFVSSSEQYAQIFIWNYSGGNLQVETSHKFKIGYKAGIRDICVGDIDLDSTPEFITAGIILNSSNFINAQIRVWNYTDKINLENSIQFIENNTHTQLLALDIENIDEDPSLEIVVGGMLGSLSPEGITISVWNLTNNNLLKENSTVWTINDESIIADLQIMDFEDDGLYEIIVISNGQNDTTFISSGEISAWSYKNSSLNLISSQNFKKNYNIVFCNLFIEDINLDGTYEILTSLTYMIDYIHSLEAIVIWNYDNKTISKISEYTSSETNIFGSFVTAANLENNSKLELISSGCMVQIDHFKSYLHIRKITESLTISTPEITYNLETNILSIVNITCYSSILNTLLNDSNAVIHEYSIFFKNGSQTDISGLLSFNISTWMALDINTSQLTNGEYYVKVHFSDGILDEWSDNSENFYITSIDFPPLSNHPEDIEIEQDSSGWIPWILIDDVGAGYYQVFINGTPSNWIEWTNNTYINYSIDTSVIGKFNYTIKFMDLTENWGDSDTVIITIIPETTTPPIPGFLAIFLVVGLILIPVIFKTKSRQII